MPCATFYMGPCPLAGLPFFSCPQREPEFLLASRVHHIVFFKLFKTRKCFSTDRAQVHTRTEIAKVIYTFIHWTSDYIIP